MTKARIILIITIIACVLSAIAINNIVKHGKGSSDKEYKSDSSFIVYTVKEYSKRDWYFFNNYARMYRITNDEITFFVERIFYSPDKKKIIAWVGKRMYNAPTIEKYSDDEAANRICPLAYDTVFHFTVLMGYKNDNGLWKLYPWGNRQVPCCKTIEKGVKELEQYYFKDIKEDYLEVVTQEGKSKGIVKNQPYKYAISDKEFWSKSPVWQMDIVGADNQYPFEVKYSRILTDTCIKCADKILLPQISYPDSLLHL